MTMMNLDIDTQKIELSGRHYLISQLLAGGVEVAQPIRDRGIDLIAYQDREGTTPYFLACPIQLKANRGARFSLDRKYEHTRNLLMTYVWYVDDPASTVVYALTYNEAFQLLEEGKHTLTATWKDKGVYTLTVNQSWIERLSVYRMTAHHWPDRLRRALGGRNADSLRE